MIELPQLLAVTNQLRPPRTGWMAVEMRVVGRDDDVSWIADHVEAAIVPQGDDVPLLRVHVQEEPHTLFRYCLRKIASELARVVVHDPTEFQRPRDALYDRLDPLRAALVVTEIAQKSRCRFIAWICRCHDRRLRL